jgi:spermidine synthase
LSSDADSALPPPASTGESPDTTDAHASELTSGRPGAVAPQGAGHVLLASVFVIAICGLIYELLAGALSAYLLGSSVTQFSIVIGIFLSAMGVGSLLSRLFTRELLRTFMIVEVLIGIIGGCSALLLFSAFALAGTYVPLLVLVCLVVGTLAGLEIPLLVRILRDQASLRAALSNVLAVDYIGALAASLLFPLLLVPRLGLVRTGFLFGLLNVAVALVGLHFFRRQIRSAGALRLAALVAAAGLVLGLVTAGRTTSLLEDVLYDDEVIYATSTPYQRLVITRWRGDLRLFIDGNIQFSSVDEFRYHEALVHPAMGLVRAPRNVLLLGAGDGLAAREILKHPGVQRVDLVDLDPEMTRIFSSIPLLTKLNAGALSDRRVKIFNEDALKFLERVDRRYDVVIIDLPDPNNESLGKLYTRSFYRLVAKHLAPTGVLVTQATSPFYARDAFWCIANTLAATELSSGGGRLRVLPYRASVPSFGEWGFVLASLAPLSQERITLKVKTRFLTPQVLPGLFVFPKDIGPRKTPINRLDDQVLVRLYERGYGRYNR